MKRVVTLFDFDGTLVDTEAPDAELLSRLFLEVGLVLSPLEVMREFVGIPRSHIMDAVRERHGLVLPPDWLETYRLGRLANECRIRPAPGVLDGLRRLSESGVEMAIVSNSRSDRLSRVVELTGLSAFFADRLYDMELVERPKPFPDIYFEAVRRLGIGFDEAVAVEDSEVGVASAASAGIKCIGYLGNDHIGADSGKRLTAAGAFAVHDTMDGVVGAVLELAGIED